jgi:hypothetical protein
MDQAAALTSAAETAAPAAETGGERLRVLHIQVTSPHGHPLSLQVPSDRTAADLESVLVHGTPFDEEGRGTHAFSPTHDNLLAVPLGAALRTPDNPHGAPAVVLQVEGKAGRFEAVLTCTAVSELEVHRAYPHGGDEPSAARVGAFLQHSDADWFCDASSGLACCAEAREAPTNFEWVEG